MCKGRKLYPFLDLGFTPPADQFLRPELLEHSEVHYPLKVNVCDDCGLVQLSHTVAPDVLYQNDYPYESSTTSYGRDHWNKFAQSVAKRLDLTTKDLVVDIGSNVGVLLGAFRDCGAQVQGVDPAPNIAEIARSNGIDTICDFFNPAVAEAIVRNRGKASVVTGTNVFAHIDDLDSVVAALKTLLNDKGVFIFEAPYLINLIQNNEYDTIYHEHLSYISVKPLIGFFRRHGMSVFDIERVDIHGGSIRVFVGRGEKSPSTRVEELIAEENRMNLYSHATLDAFAGRVWNNRKQLSWMLQNLKNQGKKIVAVSAPAKGMTLLNYCRFGTELLDFITEKSRLKIGKFTPGTHIPVVSDEELLKQKPDYALLLAWNFADEIIKNLSEFRKQGGKFIIPIPEPRIVE